MAIVPKLMKYNLKMKIMLSMLLAFRGWSNSKMLKRNIFTELSQSNLIMFVSLEKGEKISCEPASLVQLKLRCGFKTL